MRHRNKINNLGRKAAHRKKTLSSMATALILHKRINTTVTKAKALRSYVEPLITRSKEDTTHSRRTVFAYLRNKYAVTELFREISQKVADRPGGYTRILKTGFRKGDGAEMCFIELVDYNTHMLKTEEDTQQKRTRRGRRGGKKDADAAVKETTKAPVTAAEEVEQPETTADVVEKAPEATVETQEAPVTDTEEKAPEAKSETPEAEAETPEVQEAEEKAEEAAAPEAKSETPAEAKKEEADETKEDEKPAGESDQAGEDEKPEKK